MTAAPSPAHGTVTPPAGPAAELIARLRRIDDRHRAFSVGAEDAARLYGIDWPRLGNLVAAGLPCGGTSERPLCDVFDLMNTSLHLRLASVQRMAMRSWAGTLKVVDRGGRWRAVIDVSLDPRGPHVAAERPVAILLPEAGRVIFPAGSAGVVRRLEWPVRDCPVDVPDHVRALLEEVAGLDFFMLPEDVRWDLDFIRSTGMAECGGASKLLLHAAREAGVSARQWFGLLLTKPFATGHFWTEVEVGDVWVPVDPLLLKLLRHSAGLSGESWPYWRSPAAAFARLALVVGYEPSTGRPILDHSPATRYYRYPLALCGDLEVPVSFMVDLAVDPS